MLNSAQLAALLDKFATLTMLVVGDYFLDHYLILDETLTEISLETGLDAYQIVAVQASPGAAGTVTNNLRALGIKVIALGILGDDGSGYELERALRTSGVDTSGLLKRADRFTPTYTKPMLRGRAGDARELNRLDLKNRAPLPVRAQAEIIARLRALAPQVDASIVVDQVEEVECGVITTRVRDALAELGQADQSRVMAVESRAQIGEFRSMILKPNTRELLRAYGIESADAAQTQALLSDLFRRMGKPVFMTRGAEGMWVCDEAGITAVPTVRVTGPIDIVGAGDSALAALVAALSAGASTRDAALVGNLAAAVTLRQLGTTGTAAPAQIRAAHQEFMAQQV